MTLPVPFEVSEAFARRMDAEDPLRGFRDEFHLPTGRDGVYLCGHSLGPPRRNARRYLEQELDDWAALGVEDTGRLAARGSPITSS